MIKPLFIPDPSDRLLEKILSRIREERERLSIKHRLTIFSMGLIVSMATFIPALKLVQTGLEESGFSQFLSLLVSDSAIMAIYWKNFIFTLLESAPIVSVALFLSVVFVFLQSLKFLARDIKHIYQLSN